MTRLHSRNNFACLQYILKILAKMVAARNYAAFVTLLVVVRENEQQISPSQVFRGVSAGTRFCIFKIELLVGWISLGWQCLERAAWMSGCSKVLWIFFCIVCVVCASPCNGLGAHPACHYVCQKQYEAQEVDKNFRLPYICWWVWTPLLEI